MISLQDFYKIMDHLYQQNPMAIIQAQPFSFKTQTHCQRLFLRVMLLMLLSLKIKSRRYF